MNRSDRTLEEEEARLAAASLAAGDPTGWFDRLYAAGAAGRVPVPWSRREPHPLLTEWAQRHHRAGAGKRAIVPGCGLGADAEYLARLGFAVTAFDVSATAIRLARRHHPDSPVEYVTADLLHLPQRWLRAFDLVTEIITVQALPRAVRRQATASVARLTALGGTLLVIAAAHDGTGEPVPGPPWPLTRAEIESFATDGLTPAAIEMTTIPAQPTEHRWRAEFHRPLGNLPGSAQDAAKHPVSAHDAAAGPPVEISKMRWRRFLAANASGAIAWAGTYSLAAYLAGNALQQTSGMIGWVLGGAAAAAAAAALVSVRDQAGKLAVRAEAAYPGLLKRGSRRVPPPWARPSSPELPRCREHGRPSVHLHPIPGALIAHQFARLSRDSR